MIENKNDNQKRFKDKVFDIETLIQLIRAEYESCSSKSRSMDYTSLLERIVSAEKDLKTLSDKIDEIKNGINNDEDSLNKLNTSFQELSGSVNQLKLIVDEFKEYHKTEKENKVNLLFQLVIPIILAVIFFFSGLFFKSCSSIHEQNIKPKKSDNGYEYRNFESINK